MKKEFFNNTNCKVLYHNKYTGEIKSRPCNAPANYYILSIKCNFIRLYKFQYISNENDLLGYHIERDIIFKEKTKSWKIALQKIKQLTEDLEWDNG